MIVDAQTAEANLARLLELACAGEEVVIARGSEPVVKLVPVGRSARPKRVFGSMAGKFLVRTRSSTRYMLVRWTPADRGILGLDA